MVLVQKQRIRLGRRWNFSSSSYGTPVAPRSGQFFLDAQQIHTEDHPGWKTAGGQWDAGGQFESWKISIDSAGVDWTSNYNYNPKLGGWQYSTNTFLVASPEVAGLNDTITTQWGSAASNNSLLSSRVPTGPNALTMDAMGTKAIDMVKPDNPSVDLATSLAELWSERKFFSVPGKGGSLPGEYLNYQFGIAPTIADFQDLRDTIENRDAILRQYQRDSGRVIRRQYRFQPEVTSTRTVTSRPVYGMGGGLNTYQNPGGTLIKQTTTTQKFWFSGAFRYAIPKESFPRTLKELDRLYGVVPGVSTGWELIPFSWLVDYFTPIGSLVSNFDSFLLNGLVMPYAYIMSTTEVVDTYDWYGPVRNSDGHLQNIGVSSIVKKTRLRRRHATPFGFGLLASDLSPKQLSIIAALGLSLRK